MSATKNIAIGVLALATFGTASLAWRHYQELVELRASAVGGDDRAELQKRIDALQKANRELEDQLLAARHLTDEAPEEAPAPPPERTGPPPVPGERERGGGRGGRGQQMATLRELMATPEVQALVASGQKDALEARYSALFKSLNLSPEQADRLKTLLIERQNAPQDVMAAARDQGLDPRTDRDAIRKLVTDSRNAVNESIKSLLGDSGYNQLAQYEHTMPQRDVVNTLQQRLTYTDQPLNAGQAEQLVGILAANSNAANREGGRADGGGFWGRGDGPGMGGGGGVGGGGGGGGGGGARTITSEAVAQASAILTSSQLSVLQQMQRQQQQQRELQRMIRNATQQARGGAPAPAPATKSGG